MTSAFKAVVALLVTILAGQSSMASTNQLAQLVKTNSACHIQLSPVWVGSAKDTLCTGTQTNASQIHAKLLSEGLRFDWFTYSTNGIFAIFGPKAISRSYRVGETSVASYRESLPFDAQISAATKESELVKLLGPSFSVDAWGMGDGELHSQASWYVFTLRNDNELETLDVACSIVKKDDEKEWKIKGVRVTRGKAKPAGN